MNHALLEKVRYLLPNTSLDKSFWTKAIVYASHLLNRLLTVAIGGKTPLEIWSGGVARAIVHLEYLVVPPILMSGKTCWTLK